MIPLSASLARPLLISLIVDAIFSPPLWVLLAVFVPMPALSVLFVRHSKALFLAMDHYYDPQASGGQKSIR